MFEKTKTAFSAPISASNGAEINDFIKQVSFVLHDECQ
jgi:hypothetical protein